MNKGESALNPHSHRKFWKFSCPAKPELHPVKETQRQISKFLVWILVIFRKFPLWNLGQIIINNWIQLNLTKLSINSVELTLIVKINISSDLINHYPDPSYENQVNFF